MARLLHEDEAPVFSIRGVTKIYQMGDLEVRALAGVDLDLYAGEFVVILGPSGSGKSTLLNLIGGLDTPSAGQIRLAGDALEVLPGTEGLQLQILPAL